MLEYRYCVPLGIYASQCQSIATVFFRRSNQCQSAATVFFRRYSQCQSIDSNVFLRRPCPCQSIAILFFRRSSQGQSIATIFFRRSNQCQSTATVLFRRSSRWQRIDTVFFSWRSSQCQSIGTILSSSEKLVSARVALSIATVFFRRSSQYLRQRRNFETVFLVSGAVSEIAFRIRCSIEKINKVVPTISNFNVDGPFTAVWGFAKTDPPGDLTFCHSRMIAV